jgi:hypothetical protein
MNSRAQNVDEDSLMNHDCAPQHNTDEFKSSKRDEDSLMTHDCAPQHNTDEFKSSKR